MHLSRAENCGSRSCSKLHKFPAVSGKWKRGGIRAKAEEEEERGRIDTLEIYFWRKKSRANCYAIKSRAASRDSRNSGSFTFDLKQPNLVDRDVSVMVLLPPRVSPRWAKKRVNEGLISRWRGKKVYVALKFMTSHTGKKRAVSFFGNSTCDSSKRS